MKSSDRPGTTNLLAATAPPTLAGRALRAAGLAHRFVVRESALGDVCVAYSKRGVVAVELARDDGDPALRLGERLGRPVVPDDRAGQSLLDRLDRGLAGEPASALGIEFDLGVTAFVADVLAAAQTIPRGEVRSYSWLAAAAGRPRAVRAAGSAMARNPVPLLIPCHRVVRTDGQLGAYSMGGPDNKRRLLLAEGCELSSGV